MFAADRNDVKDTEAVIGESNPPTPASSDKKKE